MLENTADRAVRPVRPLIVAVALVALVAGGCSGGSGASASPTVPDAPTSFQLNTQWGSVAVLTNGHEVDLDRALASLEAGYAKARRQIGDEADRISLAGYRIEVMPESWELNGEHLRSERKILMRAGIEHVLEHELQHLFAWELSRPSTCRTYQDHAGGYDLHCRKI